MFEITRTETMINLPGEGDHEINMIDYEVIDGNVYIYDEAHSPCEEVGMDEFDHVIICIVPLNEIVFEGQAITDEKELEQIFE